MRKLIEHLAHELAYGPRDRGVSVPRELAMRAVEEWARTPLDRRPDPRTVTPMIGPGEG